MINIQVYSESVKKGLLWLISNLKSNKKNWSCSDITEFYTLWKFNHNLVEEYIKLSKKDNFWHFDYNQYLYDNHISFFYLYCIGLNNNSNYKELFNDFILDEQTVSGRISANEDNQCGALLSLVANNKKSEATKKALNYTLNNWDKFNDIQILFGMLALQELDYYLYKDILKNMTKIIIDSQQSNGMFKSKWDFILNHFEKTCYSVIVLSRMDNVKNYINKAVNYIKSLQDEKGYWCFRNDKGEKIQASYMTSLALLALNAAGEGVKISQEKVNWIKKLEKQKRELIKPYFLHTSPLYNESIHVKEIYDKIISLLDNSSKSVYICSLYLDFLYEKIINLSTQKGISFKIITRPKKDISGARGKIAKNVLDLLKVNTKGNIRTNEVIHSRLIIFDKKEVLVSSADLTRDQLVDEFNAGIYTKNPEVVEKVLNYFNNIWEQSEKL